MVLTTQSQRSVGFLGPIGTFAEEALVTQEDLVRLHRQPFNSMLEVLNSVEAGSVDLGFVPIENMIEGAVTSSIDTLAFGTGLLIRREVTMDVRLKLMALPGAELDNAKYLRSYPVAYAQCSRFLTRRLPSVIMVAANSTAEAAVLRWNRRRTCPGRRGSPRDPSGLLQGGLQRSCGRSRAPSPGRLCPSPAPCRVPPEAW